MAIKGILFDLFGVLYTDTAQSTKGANKDIIALAWDLKKQGYKIALASNASDATAKGFVTSLNLESLFDAVVASETVGKPKPHPNFFTAVSKALGIDLPEMLLIDDSQEIIE